MTDKKFNLLKYVYGRLYAGTYTNNTFIEESKKVYSWYNCIKWLNKEGYVFKCVVKDIGDGKCRITYVFNHQNKIYENYLKAIDKNMSYHQLSLVPTGEIVEKKNISEFEQERLDKFSNKVIYITKEDRVPRKVKNLW